MLPVELNPPTRKAIACQVDNCQIAHASAFDYPNAAIAYVAEGDEDGVFDTDAEGDGEEDGVLDTDAEGDGEVEGDVEADAEGLEDGLLDAEADAMTVPRFPSRASQRCVPEGPDPETVTEIRLRKSLASAKVA